MAELLCAHCLHRAPRRRGLCSPCWADRRIRGRHLAKLLRSAERFPAYKERAAERSDEELDELCEAMLNENPLYKPCPFHPTDPRYNVVVADREAAGLPARHPGDQPAGLE